MKKDKLKHNTKKAFSLIEVLLAIFVFSLMSTGLAGAILYATRGTNDAGLRQKATYLSQEGIEAVRNIRDANFSNLINGTYGLSVSSNAWSLSGSSDTIDNFTRTITISTIDANTKQIVSNVTIPNTTYTASITEYLTNWDRTVYTGKGGVLVYGNTTGLSDTMQYRTLGTDGVWSTPANMADVDVLSINRVPRVVKIYASSTRNEKIVVSKHYNGATQFIYAQVFNGTTWGSVQLLSQWNATTFLDVQNFDATYQQNGNLVVVYSDNTTTPKFRTWNGTVWSSQINTLNTGGIPNYVVVKNRASTNEIMAAFFDQSNDTNTLYFNGGSYVSGSWALHTEHSSTAPTNTKRFVDFAWSPNDSTRGALIYASGSSDTSINLKIWTANGAGAGTWSTAVDTSPVQTNILGALSITGRPGANEFVACDKDANATPRIICYRALFSPAPSWSNPTNAILVTGTTTGIQRSYDVAYEAPSGEYALNIYSDVTGVGKLKKYNPTTNTWDATATNLPAIGSNLETVRTIPDNSSNDIMILFGDTIQDLYSVVWDGTNNALYTTPVGKGLVAHGTLGSADADFWYDFSWDKN